MSKDNLFDFSIKWDGLDELLKGLDKAADEVIKAIEEGVNDAASDLLSKAQQLAPRLTGDLEGSGHLGKLQNTGAGIQRRVIFSTPYALRRHEEPYRPGKHMEYGLNGEKVGYIIVGRGPITRSKASVDGMRPGRKYLERPLKKNADKYQKHIADKVKEVLNK